MGRPENYFDLFIQTHPKERGTIMSRILHCSSVPLTIDYWDYYILCCLDIEAARVLQRMEYWDGTKSEQPSNHSFVSEAAPSSTIEPEDNHYFWKSEEELH